MPLYEYQCLPNGHRFEVRHGMSEDPVKTCPECGGDVRRVIHPVGIVFKGSGFYATDSRQGGAKPASQKSDESSAKPQETSPAATTDSSAKSDSSTTTSS